MPPPNVNRIVSTLTKYGLDRVRAERCAAFLVSPPVKAPERQAMLREVGRFFEATITDAATAEELSIELQKALGIR